MIFMTADEINLFLINSHYLKLSENLGIIMRISLVLKMMDLVSLFNGISTFVVYLMTKQSL